MPIIAYKCPNCSSGMEYDTYTEMLTCHSCRREDNIQDMQDPLAKYVFTDEDAAAEYHCHSCGAIIITEAETSATSCSFCGSAVVLGDRLTGNLAPAKILPFAISKEEAVIEFKRWCRRGLITPRGFLSAKRIKGMTGMYVPFWLYDLHNEIEVHGKGTKVSSYRSGDYDYTETAHFDFYREICLDYVKVPVDASEKMTDELMDRLEPFPYDKLEDFKTPYLAGYVAETYSYNDEELLPRVKEKIHNYIFEYIDSTVTEYATVKYDKVHIHMETKRADYVLLPVWVLHYDYNKLEYTFAMNGQTGKVVGKPPISKPKVFAWFAGLSAILFLIFHLVSYLYIGGKLG